MTLCNRGQPLYTLAAGVAQGDGGGGLKLPNIKGGEALIAAAGAERGVHVLEAGAYIRPLLGLM
jgi:hypothetical protein